MISIKYLKLNQWKSKDKTQALIFKIRITLKAKERLISTKLRNSDPQITCLKISLRKLQPILSNDIYYLSYNYFKYRFYGE